MNSKIKRDEHLKASTSLALYRNHLQEENDERNGRKATRPGPKEIQAIQSRTFRNVRHGVLVIMRKTIKSKNKITQQIEDKNIKVKSHVG